MQWRWLLSCLRVEVGAVSTPAWVDLELCSQSCTAVAVVRTGAGVTSRVKGGSGSVAIARMACSGTTKPVEKFHWIWFSALLKMGHWNCIVLFSLAFVWAFRLYSTTNWLAKGPCFHKKWAVFAVQSWLLRLPGHTLGRNLLP